MLIDLGQSLGVVPTQVDFLPEVFGGVGPFDGFKVEGHTSFFFTDSSVAGVGEGAGGSVAEASDGIGVSTELTFVGFCFGEGGFMGAELVIYYRPYHFIVLHG